MGVTKPTPGATLAAADVTGMHASVRALINGLGAANIGRHALGAQHLPGVLLTSDTVEVTAPVLVTTSPAGFVDNATANFATWQDLTSYYVDNSGAGYSIQPGFLIPWVSLEVSQFANGSPFLQVDHQCWFNLYWRIDGANVLRVGNSRPMWGEVLAGDSKETHQVISIMDYYVVSAAATLNRVGVFAAKNRGGSAGVVPNVTVLCGTAGFLHFYPYT